MWSVHSGTVSSFIGAEHQALSQYCRHITCSQSSAREWSGDRRKDETEESTRGFGLLDIICEHAMRQLLTRAGRSTAHQLARR